MKKQANLIVLTARKTDKGTELYEGGKFKALIPKDHKQPRKNQKTIVLNCWTFALKFE